MTFDQLQFDLKHSPSVKLLRSQNAALVLSFLHEQFKQGQRPSIPFDELETQLEATLESFAEQDSPAFPLSATQYLKQWANEDHRIVRVIYRGKDEMVELTPETERAIAWVESFYQQGFVGTESRFLSIFTLLNDMIEGSTEDVMERLAQLERQRDSIEAQMNEIKTKGRVEPYSDTQLRERFLQANTLARDLLGDFATLEQRFRDIARDLQEKQVQPNSRKGKLVGYVLDADSQLRNSDEGRSFYAFWEFLMSPSKQDELEEMLQAVYTLRALEGLTTDHTLLRGVTRALITAGDKIVSSNHRLAEQLRRLLDERVLSERRRVRELIATIKQQAFQQDPGQEEAFLELDGSPEISLPMERVLWEPNTFTAPTLQPQLAEALDFSDSALHSLYNQFSVDESRLKAHIETLLNDYPECTLSQVTQQFPVQQGLAEVLTYLTIANREGRHSIDLEKRETIHVKAGEVLHLPLVTFRSGYAAR